MAFSPAGNVPIPVHPAHLPPADPSGGFRKNLAAGDGKIVANSGQTGRLREDDA
jgi:hypothetical protein